MARITDLEHFAGEIAQKGVIASVDHAAATCTIDVGDFVTVDLPWLSPRAGALRVWSPPTVGEQCLLICPEGDIANGVVLVGLWTDAFVAPSTDADIVHAEFQDGAILSYDHAAHALVVTLPAGGTVKVDAPGGCTINGPVTINGLVTVNNDVKITGTATADTDVVGGGKSLKGHKHSGVQSGAAQTGAPV